MNPTLAKIVILGIPLLLSLSWFVYWVLRITFHQKRQKLLGRNRA
ncbi:MAG TPA: hypothetical protein VFH83_14695 [Spirochaetia bacterium]|nr:hypothetical protein [Spirochaetia bacterium]